jgi:hypothetical protein
MTNPIHNPSNDLFGEDEVTIEATLNGRPLRRRVKARQHLADFLRQEMELTGTHLGCEHGICGACTVLIDGRTARGCLTLAAQFPAKLSTPSKAWPKAASWQGCKPSSSPVTPHSAPSARPACC